MENKEDPATGSADNKAEWILESLVIYLSGPIWVTPILNFIEQKSVVFDGTGDHDDEYHKIHEDYRNLVDMMLGAYMEDLNLQPEDLETALGQVKPSIRSAALQTLLEPVQSAADYERFKSLMRNKNEQLHNEALEMLRQKHGNPHHLSAEDEGNQETQHSDVFSDEDINEAIRQSLADHAAERFATATDKRDVDRALAASIAGLLTINTTGAENKSSESTDTPAEAGSAAEPLTAASEAERFGSPEEMEARRNALRAQRDKILSRKRKERELQLQKQEQVERLATEKGFGGQRPRSGRAARAALNGEKTAVDDKTIEYRRLLLQKIKEEVESPPKYEMR